MPNYIVYWSKRYYASSTVEVEANNKEEAEKFVEERMGDYEGSMQYDPDADKVEAYPTKENNNA